MGRAMAIFGLGELGPPTQFQSGGRHRSPPATSFWRRRARGRWVDEPSPYWARASSGTKLRGLSEEVAPVVKSTLPGSSGRSEETCAPAALAGIGRNQHPALASSRIVVMHIGPVDIDYGDDNCCERLDVLKHLTGDFVRKKLGT